MREAKNDLVLVLGIDGSGKSTFLNKLSQHLGYVTLEPTSTPAARQFKNDTLDEPLWDDLVSRREELYLDLNRDFDRNISSRLSDGEHIATTGSSLVTAVSHQLMREVIGAGTGEGVEDVARNWLDDPNSLKPSTISLVHAETATILDRIRLRQDNGDQAEKFWGFNSPFFLIRYQEAWHRVVSVLTRESGIVCVSLDSSQLSPEEMLDKYHSEVNDGHAIKPSSENKAEQKELAAAKLTEQAYELIEARYGRDGYCPLEYHDTEHTRQVVEAALLILEKVSETRNVSPSDRRLLTIAAVFHDVQQGEGSGRNEEISADIALKYMQDAGCFNEEEQARVRSIIMATQLDFDGETIVQNVTSDYLTQVMADADLSMLGLRPDIYWKRASRLFNELYPNAGYDGLQFQNFLNNNLLVFLGSHKFHTPEAAELFYHKPENIELLNSMKQ